MPPINGSQMHKSHLKGSFFKQQQNTYQSNYIKQSQQMQQA